MATEKPTNKPFVQVATEWLNGPLFYSPNRVEFLCFVVLFAMAIWWFAREWGWNEGMADAARLRAQARRDEWEASRDRDRRELREDVAAGVTAALGRERSDG